MDLKQELKKEVAILGNSLEMYKETKKEVKEVFNHETAAERTINDVIANLEKEIIKINEMLSNYEEKKAMEYFEGKKRINMQLCWMKKNRFIISFDFEKEIRIPEYVFDDFIFNESDIHLSIKESLEFFSLAYFKEKGENIKDAEISVSLLDPLGVEVMKMKFTGVNFIYALPGSLKYAEDDVWKTSVHFSYKDVSYIPCNATN